MTEKEKKVMFDRLVTFGCCVCRNVHGVYTPAQIHHLTGIKYRATGKKANDEHVIPLCHAHHQGHLGIHHLGTRAWEEMFGSQEEHMSQVNGYLERLN